MCFSFDIVCTVHRNQLYKQTNNMHLLYVFILQSLYNSTCFERTFHSSSGVHDLLYLQFCTNHTNVSNCLVLRLGLVPTGRSQHADLYKNCSINKYRKCVLLVCLYNVKVLRFCCNKYDSVF